MSDVIDPTTRRLIDEPRQRGGVGYFQKTIGVDDTKGFFSFNPCTQATSDFGGRCDVGWIGPTSFHRIVDGVCNCGSLDTDPSTSEVCQHGHASAEAIVFAAPFFSAPPIGYICYSEARDSTQEDLFCRHHWNGNARTLQELFKLMYEWRDCHILLGDNSEIAQTADALLNVLDVPEGIETWVRTAMPDGPVVRYLNGEEHARDRATGIPDMPDSMSNWLWIKVKDMSMAFGGLGIQPSTYSA